MDTSSSKINEPLLREYDQAEAITGATIARTAEGYVLVVQVSWKRGDLVVYNQRGKPRAWASLDRLLSYLNEMVPSVKSFELVLDEPLVLPDDQPMSEAMPPAVRKKVVASRKAATKAAARPATKAKAGNKPARAS